MAVNTEEVFKKIEKQNGKIFARVMRGDDSAIPEGSTPFRHVNLLDTPDLVNMLRYAGKDPNDAIKLIPVIKERHDKALGITETKQESFEDPIKMLDRAGYKAWYVNDPDDKNKSVEDMVRDQNAIGGYFRSAKAVKYGMTGGHRRTNVGTPENGEMICTIYTNLDRGAKRFNENYIINAVKKEADGDDKLPESEWHIKPSSHPEREDEYGRSVISIQILKTGGAISIKNRYNHTVTDPDNTFNSNPDDIIPGLSAALKHKFGIGFTVSKSKIPENYIFIHNQLIRYNFEVDNVYFGDNFYLNGSDITELDDKHEVMLDNIILDTDFGKKARTVLLYQEKSTDELVRVINDEISGCKVTKATEKGETIITIIDKNKQKKELARVKDGQITSLHLYKTTELGKGFLSRNKSLKELYAPKLEIMVGNCLHDNAILETLNVPELKKMGYECFYKNNALKELNAPKLKEIGYECFYCNESLKELNAPKLETMEEGCFRNNAILETLNIPELKEMGKWCFCDNESLKELNAPKLEIMEEGCFINNKILETLNIPELKEMGKWCFWNNNTLKELNAPKLEIMEENCFYKNKSLQELNAPKLETMEYGCFDNNENLEILNIQELKAMPNRCFENNKKLKELNAPKLKSMGYGCFRDNEIIEKINIPELEKMDSYCFRQNKSLKELNVPKLEEMERECFAENKILETLNIPELKEMRARCFEQNKSLKKLYAPKLEIMVDGCFRNNEILETLSVPELKIMGYGCFRYSKSLKELNAPKLEDAEKRAFMKRALRRKKIQQTAKKVLFKLGLSKAKQPDTSAPTNNSIQEER